MVENQASQRDSRFHEIKLSSSNLINAAVSYAYTAVIIQLS